MYYYIADLVISVIDLNDSHDTLQTNIKCQTTAKKTNILFSRSTSTNMTKYIYSIRKLQVMNINDIYTYPNVCFYYAMCIRKRAYKDVKPISLRKFLPTYVTKLRITL